MRFRQPSPALFICTLLLTGAACSRPSAGTTAVRAPEEAPPSVVFEQGKDLYFQHCAQCHLSGQGTDLVPPLIGAPGATESAARTIRAVIKGVSGPLTVNGKTYNGIMPPMDWLEDAEVAAIVTYVRTEYGNQSGDVPPEKVASLRED